MLILMLLVLLISGIQFKKSMFRALGFNKQRFNIKNLLLFAPVVALLLTQLHELVLAPLVTSITGSTLDLSYFQSLKGNLTGLLISLPLVWLSAAFAEEIVFRGFLMRQFSRVFGESKISLTINIIGFAILFGWFHGYQGLSGQILSGLVGALLASIFYWRKYDLWLCIFIHGFFDTLALISFYFG